jgi:hypothetical protein
MFASVLKRSALIEAWLTQHFEHYPGPHLESYVEDSFMQKAVCSCGAEATFTIVVHVETLPKAK